MLCSLVCTLTANDKANPRLNSSEKKRIPSGAPRFCYTTSKAIALLDSHKNDLREYDWKRQPTENWESANANIKTSPTSTSLVFRRQIGCPCHLQIVNIHFPDDNGGISIDNHMYFHIKWLVKEQKERTQCCFCIQSWSSSLAEIVVVVIVYVLLYLVICRIIGKWQYLWIYLTCGLANCQQKGNFFKSLTNKRNGMLSQPKSAFKNWRWKN